MHIAKSLVFIGSTLLAVTAFGCAAEQAEEPTDAASSFSTTTPMANDGAGGGAVLADNTLFMKADQRSVFYDNSDDRAIIVSVCAASADPALVKRIAAMTGSGGQPHLIIEKKDGTFDTRISELPHREENVYYCKGGKLGGSAYTIRLWADHDDSFLKGIDLSAALVSGFTGARVKCESGVQMAGGVELDVKGFRVDNGKVKVPEISLKVTGESSKGVRGRCYVESRSKHVVFAGVVPVYFEVQAVASLQLSLNRAASFRATIGTKGASVESSDPSFVISPQVELGVTFYGLVGAYIGAEMPMTITPMPPCTPKIEMSVNLRAGASIGLQGFMDLPITKTLNIEAGTTVAGPFVVSPSRCH